MAGAQILHRALACLADRNFWSAEPNTHTAGWSRVAVHTRRTPSRRRSTPVSTMNAASAASLRQSIAAAFCFAESETRLSELETLVEDCDALGIELAELAAPLDAAVAVMAARDAEPQAKRQRAAPESLPGEGRQVIEVGGLEPYAASLLLTYAGRYCSVIGQAGLALAHYRAALVVSPQTAAPPSIGTSSPQVDSCAAEAQLGMAQSSLALGHREHAASLTLGFWRSPHSAGASRAHMALAFLLAALADAFPSAPPDALVLLRRLSPLLASPACSAVESLAARWLPSQVPAAVRGGGEHSLLAEPFVQAALVGSRTFGSLELEPLVCAARRQLLFLLLRHASVDSGGAAGGSGGAMVIGNGCGCGGGGAHHPPAGGGHHLNGGGSPGCSLPGAMCLGGSSGGGGSSSSAGIPGLGTTVGGMEGARLQRIEAAAAVASWAIFADFCLDEGPAETAAVTLACGAIEAGLSAASTEWPLAHPNQLAYLAAAAMYQDLSELRAVELWLRDPDVAEEVGRRLLAAGLPRLWAMLEAHVIVPRQRARRAERIAVLTPIHSEAVRAARPSPQHGPHEARPPSASTRLHPHWQPSLTFSHLP